MKLIFRLLCLVVVMAGFSASASASAQAPSPRACDAARRSGHPLAGCARVVRPTPARPRVQPPRTVAPPALPPAPRPAPAMPGPFIVYFGFDSARITPEAVPILDEVVAAWRRLAASNVRITIAAHTDSRASAAHSLSYNEGASVHDYLVAHGVPARAIIGVRAFGATRPRAAGNDEVAWAMNRRAEITFVPRESAR